MHSHYTDFPVLSIRSILCHDTYMYVPPPVLLGIAIALSYVISVQFPILQFTDVSISFAGIIFITAGISLFLWAIKLLRKHRTTLRPHGKPSKLITYGPYRLSRNPIYLGFLMISIGTVLLFANVLAFAGPIIFFVFISTFVIPMEESMLTKVFGKSYKSYNKKIRRWI